MKILLLFGVLGLLPVALFGQVRIADLQWHVDGRTRIHALESVADLAIGQEFASVETLDAYLAAQRQVLFNQRQLQEVRVEKTLLQEDEYRVDVFVLDSWNLVALPYFRYDSNDGLLLSIRIRDYNFFGSLESLRINLDYNQKPGENDSISMDTNVRYPFTAWERSWHVIFNQGLEIQEDSLDATIGVGVGHEFRMGGLVWENEIIERYRWMRNDDKGDSDFFTTEWTLGTELQTPVHLGWYGPLTYRPGVLAEINYRGGSLSEDRRGLTTGFSQSLNAGGFDWIGNYRKGNVLTIANRNTYNFHRDEFSSRISARSAHYLPLQREVRREAGKWPRAGVSGSVSGFFFPTGTPEDQDNAAEDIRGVLNDTMQGNLGLFFNLDATVTALTIPRLMEGHVNVFFDGGYVVDTNSGDNASDRGRSIKYGTGVELIGFPLFARALYLRVSYGIDVWRVLDDGMSPTDSRARVIFIGLRHHY